MLEIFEGPDFIDENESLLKDFDNRHVEEFVHDKNKCLRLPGSVCHSNLDCALMKKSLISPGLLILKMMNL